MKTKAKKMLAFADMLIRSADQADGKDVSIMLGPDLALSIANTLQAVYGVPGWALTDFDRVISGLLCVHHRMCRTCNFRCAKWLGEDYDPGKYVAEIRKTLDHWEKRQK